MPVGNVHSQERGAGARYNDGKVPLELIPVWILARFEQDHDPEPITREQEVLSLIHYLADWQQGYTDAIAIIETLGRGDAEDAARVFGYGAKKYAAWNWIKGMPWSVPLGCALRHAFAILRGEEMDPESGLPHRGHLVCNLIMLAQFERTYPEGDDRPVKWLSPQADSTEGPAAPSGGPVSLEVPVSRQVKEIGIEQPQCFDPWFRKQKEIPVSEGQRMYEEWLKRHNTTTDPQQWAMRSTPTSDSLETSSQNAGPSPSSGGFDPAD